MRKFSSSSTKGFTLIELLVVIAIIAILAAILFPVFAQARAKARQAACLSNQKQIGLAMMQYVQDYDEKFPIVQYFGVGTVKLLGAYGWFTPLAPYLKSIDVLSCPSSKSWYAISGGRSVSSAYGYDTCSALLCGIPQADGSWTCLWKSNDPATLSMIHSPASVISVFEVARGSTMGDINSGFFGDFFGRFDSGGNPIIPVHNNGATFVFADGHAKWFSVVNHPCWNSPRSYPIYMDPPQPWSITGRWAEKQIAYDIAYEP